MPDFFGDLNAFREDLVASGILGPKAFAQTNIAGIIDIDDDGAVLGVELLKKKDTIRDELPTIPDRTSAPVPAFLTGSGEYWGGLHRPLMFSLHNQVLHGVNHPAASATLAFLSGTLVAQVDLPAVPGFYTLRHKGEFVHRVEEVRRAWESHYQRNKPEELNPRVRLWPGQPFIRLGTSHGLPAESTYSYSGAANFLRAIDPGGAADALSWLLDRPSTVRHNGEAIIAWISGDPFIDPTRWVFPIFYKMGDEVPAPEVRNTLHFAILTARPPARMSLRYYWSGPAEPAKAALSDFYDRMRQDVAWGQNHDAPPQWPLAFYDSPRWGVMIMTVMQAVLCGDKMPFGVMGEIMRLERKRYRFERYAVGLAGEWHRGYLPNG